MEKLFLIDGSGFIFRAYHALPPLTSPDGTPVGAVYGFCTMLRQLLKEHHYDHFLVVFDAARQTFRQEIYPDYKAHRPPPPDDLVPQFSLIKEACQAFGLPHVEMLGYEADDLIASYTKIAQQKNYEVVIVSADKDLMQLVSDTVTLYDPLKRRNLGFEAVFEKFGVTPDKVIDVQALVGDTSDNVPGVPGIGVKTAAELIKTFGDLETLLKQAHVIKQPKRRQALIENSENAKISKKLVTLVDDIDVPLSLDNLHVKEDSSKAKEFCIRLGFRSLIGAFDGVNGKSNNSPSPKSSTLSSISQSFLTLQSKEDVETFLNNAYKAQAVAIDTETTSLHIYEAKLVGISLAYRNHQGIQAAYIPLTHQVSDKQVNLAEIKSLLHTFLLDPAVLKVGHNLKYDMAILAQVGLEIAPYHDTLLMSYSLTGGQHSHSLDSLAERELNYKTLTYEEVVGTGKSQKTFDEIDLKTATLYAAEDAYLTLSLYEVLNQKLAEAHLLNLYETVERPIVPFIVQMERNGVKIDDVFLKQYGNELFSRASHLEEEIYKLAGKTFNIGSPKQLGEILFDELSLPSPKKTKTGAYVTDADVLESLARQGHMLPQKVLEWRSLTKLQSTYVEGLLKAIHPKTRRVHTSFSLSGTVTGRLSSSEPNLQNIPIRTEDGRKIRQAIIAEEGFQLVSLDYSQIELRLLSHFADIPSLTEAFLKNVDIHKTTASHLFHVPYDDVTPEQRRQAKTVNFGIIYGISAYGLSQQLLIPQSEASNLIKAYFERYPGVEAYMEKMKEFARKHGFVETLLKRRCYTQGIHDKNPTLRNFAERQAINAPLQGSNADIIKKAMGKIYQNFHTNSKIRPLLQVHDELLFEIHNDEVDSFIPLAKKIMQSVATLKVPLIVEAGIGNNWDEAH